MNLLVTNKKTSRNSQKSDEMRHSSVVESTHDSYISFNPQLTTRNKWSEHQPNETRPKPERYIHLASKIMKQMPTPITSRVKKEEKPQQWSMLSPLQGFCSCIAKTEDRGPNKIKERIKDRQDLSMLIVPTGRQKKQEKSITPINSLLELLKQ